MQASERDGLPEVPSGTVTFLFTDIEGSTQLLEQLRDGYVIAGLPANFPPLKARPASRASAIRPDQFAAFGQLLSFLRQRAGLTQRE